MLDSSIYDNIVINTYACVVFSIVGLSIVSDLHNLISNKLFKIKNVFGFSSAVIYIYLFLAISYFIGVLFISVHLGEFVLVDETIMNTLFWGSLGTARAVHFAYTASSTILVVIYKYYIYEPDIEKQG